MIKKKLFGIIALIVGIMFIFSFTACDPANPDNNDGDDDDDDTSVAVSWTGLTANGVANVNTTALTLTFDKNPTTLADSNITVEGATKGSLTGSNTTRTLSISNITVAEGENITVTITNPSGYSITTDPATFPTSKSVAVHKASEPHYSGGTTYTKTTSGSGHRFLYFDEYGYEIGYELYATGGSAEDAKITIYKKEDGSGSAFRSEWSNNGNYLGRVGWYWNEGESYDYYGDLFCDFDFTKDGTAGGYSYIGIYGWSRDPDNADPQKKLIEYYITEDCYNSSAMPTPGTYVGEFEANDGTYKIYKNLRVNQPSLDGNTTFWQYFSIRQTRRQSGTINITEHFDKWEELGISMGTNMIECKFKVEAGGGTGYFDASEVKLYAENTPIPPSYGLQDDGSFTLNPKGFSTWYGAAKTGNKISFTNGGMYYFYPEGFNITDYGSLEIEYTVSNVKEDVYNSSNNPNFNDGQGGAAIVVKVMNALSGSGTNAKFTYLDETPGPHTLIINETGNYQDKTFVEYWHANTKGFAIAVNTYDTNDTFDITFHSITFYPPED